MWDLCMLCIVTCMLLIEWLHLISLLQAFQSVLMATIYWSYIWTLQKMARKVTSSSNSLTSMRCAQNWPSRPEMNHLSLSSMRKRKCNYMTIDINVYIYDVVSDVIVTATWHPDKSEGIQATKWMNKCHK